jgi:preprotein translocase subunit Sec63
MGVLTKRSKSSVSIGSIVQYNCLASLCGLPIAIAKLAPNFYPPMSDYYAALGLASSATLADVKKAYRQKAAFYHPDRNDAEDAADRFRTVQAAYDVLVDPEKRQAYDDNRRRNLLDNPLETAQGIWHNYFRNLI